MIGCNYSLKKVVSPLTVKNTRFHTAVLESGGPIHKDTDPSGPIFQAVLFLRG
jgi:hypothetical protein